MCVLRREFAGAVGLVDRQGGGGDLCGVVGVLYGS